MKTSVCIMLLDLPDALAIGILVNWIDLIDLGRLDSAFCNSQHRVQFSRLISSNEFVLNDNLNIEDEVSCLRWCIRRKVKYTWLMLKKGINLSMLAQYFKALGGSYFNIISAKQVTENAPSMFKLIAKYCRNIKHILIERCSELRNVDFMRNSSESLIQLRIDNCSIASDARVDKLRFPAMKFMALKGPIHVKVIQGLLMACPSLTRLSLESPQVEDERAS